MDEAALREAARSSQIPPQGTGRRREEREGERKVRGEHPDTVPGQRQIRGEHAEHTGTATDGGGGRRETLRRPLIDDVHTRPILFRIPASTDSIIMHQQDTLA